MSQRLLVYDGTPNHSDRWLRRAWASGCHVYRALGRVDASYGAKSWADALRWLCERSESVPIREIQFWGHGKWGAARIAGDELGEASFEPRHAHYAGLSELRSRLVEGGDALVWFRTCETFGGSAGHRFAERCATELGAKVAGHTHVIAAWQSGLHGLIPGQKPHWAADEGLQEGTIDAPIRAHWSSASAPHTIHFMNGRVPPGWFERTA